MSKNDAHIKLEYTMKDTGEGIYVTGSMTDEGFIELSERVNEIPKEAIPQLIIKILMKRCQERIKALTSEKINDLMDYFQKNPDALFSTSVLPYVEDDNKVKYSLAIKIKREDNNKKIDLTTQLRLQKLPEAPHDLADIMQAVTSFELVQYSEEIQQRTEEEWMQKFEECGEKAEELHEKILKRRKLH